MNENSVISLLLRLQKEVSPDHCYGIRFENNELVIFYHPYGCDEEWVSNIEEIDNLLNKIKGE